MSQPIANNDVDLEKANPITLQKECKILFAFSYQYAKHFLSTCFQEIRQHFVKSIVIIKIIVFALLAFYFLVEKFGEFSFSTFIHIKYFEKIKTVGEFPQNYDENYDSCYTANNVTNCILYRRESPFFMIGLINILVFFLVFIMFAVTMFSPIALFLMWMEANKKPIKIHQIEPSTRIVLGSICFVELVIIIYVAQIIDLNALPAKIEIVGETVPVVFRDVIMECEFFKEKRMVCDIQEIIQIKLLLTEICVLIFNGICFALYMVYCWFKKTISSCLLELWRKYNDYRYKLVQ